MRRGAKRYSAYRVTTSEHPQIEVSAVMVDSGWDLTRTWEYVDFADPEYAVQRVTGKRIARLCATCINIHDRAAAYQHEGEHSRRAPLYTPEDTDE